MKKSLSLLFTLILLLNTFLILPIEAAASQEPKIFETVQIGKILEKSSGFFVTSYDKEYSYTKNKGKKITLNKNSKIRVIGRSSSSHKLFYVKKKINGKTYFGYINDKYISIDNTENYEKMTSSAVVNPKTKKKCKYSYYEYNDMPFYVFYQFKSGIINNLKISNSCGPHSLATVLSAIMDRVITPEELMQHMSKSSVTSNRKGTYISKLTDSIHTYINDKYNYNFTYKKIRPQQAFSYLKKGYFVILGVENLDNQNLFTSYSHYITLVDYDDSGNIMTMNTNGKTLPLESFSVSRIKKYLLNSKFYIENTVAIKYDYNENNTEFSEPLTITATEDTVISDNINQNGYYTEIDEESEMTATAVYGNYLYCEYNDDGETIYGYIPLSASNIYADVTLSESKFIYDNNTHIPNVSVTDNDGNELRLNEDYTVEYENAESSDAGTYNIKINYLSHYIGENTKTYEILPENTKITSLKSGKSKIKVKLKDAENISGCQIEYSRFKNFSNSLKKNISANKHSVTLKTSYSNQKYYVRVRTYVISNDEKIYSDWSSAKKVSVK